MLRRGQPSLTRFAAGLSTLGGLAVAAGRDRRAAAAVEFALILPLMLLLYVGAEDVSGGVMYSRKISQLSRGLADLVSQQSTQNTMTSATLQNILAAAGTLMAPFKTTGVTMTVSGIDIKAKSSGLCCDATVRWSYTQGGTLRSCAGTLTQVPDDTTPTVSNIPQSLVVPLTPTVPITPTYLIIADVYGKYMPWMTQASSWFSTGMRKTIYMVPRGTSQIVLASPVTTAAGQTGTVCY